MELYHPKQSATILEPRQQSRPEVVAKVLVYQPKPKVMAYQPNSIDILRLQYPEHNGTRPLNPQSSKTAKSLGRPQGPARWYPGGLVQWRSSDMWSMLWSSCSSRTCGAVMIWSMGATKDGKARKPPIPRAPVPAARKIGTGLETMRQETRRMRSRRTHREAEVVMTARATMPAEEAPESSKPRIGEGHANGPGRPPHRESSANESGRTAPPMGRP